MASINLKIDPNDIARRLLDLSKRTGYEIAQNHGQRIYGGPPPGWSGTAPERGTEVYCYRIPRDCFEDELVPVFSSVGPLYELRLMIEFSGANRSYCYVRYCNNKDARTAIERLNNYHIRPGYPLAITKSVDNRKLCVKTVPPLNSDITEAAATKELANLVSGVTGVKFIARRWLQVEFESHRLAALARRQLVPGNIAMFGRVEIKQVDWADPEAEDYDQQQPVNNVQNKAICIKNVGPKVEETRVKQMFNIISGGCVDNVVKSADLVLITFLTQEAAMFVMSQSHDLMLEGNKLSLSWWQSGSQNEGAEAVYKPPSSVTGHGSGLPNGGYVGPLEQLNKLCQSQGWGNPDYACLSSLDMTGQHVYQYHVSVPRISQSQIYGEASHDRLLALINCACAALQAISAASMQQFSSPPPYYRTPPPQLPSSSSMTVLQPPPASRRGGSTTRNTQTIVRPTKEETNLLGGNVDGGNPSSLTSMTPLDLNFKDLSISSIPKTPSSGTFSNKMIDKPSWC